MKLTPSLNSALSVHPRVLSSTKLLAGILSAALGTLLSVSSFAAGRSSELSLPLTTGTAPGSFKSVLESQKGGSAHIGEGLLGPSPQQVNQPLLDNSPAPLPNKPLACKLNVLRKLGWEIDTSLPSHALPQIQVNSACYSKAVDELRSNHAMKLSLPGKLSSATDVRKTNDAVDDALTGEGTFCAYETFVGPAAQRASKSLYTNHLYSFTTFLGTGSVRLGNLPLYWTRVPCKDDDKCWQPLSAPSYAFEALYSGNFATECGTGLQMAEYAMIYELFGRKEFDQRFRNSELYVGDWPSITPSASVIHGTTGRRYFSKDGLDYAGAGPQMFLGVSGYIGNVLGDKYLDTPIDRGENMLIVRTSDDAARDFVKNGGLPYYNLAAQRIWKLAQQRSDDDNEMLADNYETRAELAADKAADAAAVADAAELKMLLNDPFLRDTIVYVHDIGFRSLGQHLLRLVKLNPRTPYSIRFYAESTHGEIFDRWIKMQLDNCND